MTKSDVPTAVKKTLIQRAAILKKPVSSTLERPAAALKKPASSGSPPKKKKKKAEETHDEEEEDEEEEPHEDEEEEPHEDEEEEPHEDEEEEPHEDEEEEQPLEDEEEEVACEDEEEEQACEDEEEEEACEDEEEDKEKETCEDKEEEKRIHVKMKKGRPMKKGGWEWQRKGLQELKMTKLRGCTMSMLLQGSLWGLICWQSFQVAWRNSLCKSLLGNHLTTKHWQGLWKVRQRRISRKALVSRSFENGHSKPRQTS